MDNRTCTITEAGEQCAKEHYAHGMCRMHRRRCLRHGSPYLPQKLPTPDLPGERWLPVVGWEGLYEVSDRGRVRSLLRRTPAGTRGGQILKAKISQRTGYAEVSLRATPRRTLQRVHRLVLEAFAGPCPDGQESLHGPGGPGDNRWPENLRWGTKVENAADKLRDGTDSRGERCGSHKLTAVQVLEIRERLAGGETQAALGAEFGVLPSTIWACSSGKSWAWL